MVRGKWFEVNNVNHLAIDAHCLITLLNPCLNTGMSKYFKAKVLVLLRVQTQPCFTSRSIAFFFYFEGEFSISNWKTAYYRQIVYARNHWQIIFFIHQTEMVFLSNCYLCKEDYINVDFLSFVYWIRQFFFQSFT
jgi:hypothetical protein